MSGESTPILSGAILAFKMFMTQWEHICNNQDNTKEWVEVGVSWAMTYYNCMDLTQAYIIAMCELVSVLSLSVCS